MYVHKGVCRWINALYSVIRMLMGPGCDNISLWVDLVAISLACTVNSQVGVYLVSALSLYICLPH